MLHKVECCKAKTLFQAGRTVLVKSVAATIPSYAMSTFFLPSSVSNALDKNFEDFWWGFPKGKNRNLSLKSWSSVCIPRKLGGLGFRLMKNMNLALLAKLGWKLLSNSNHLWVS